ncbi:FadR/GntR family transcriptional regulator [Sphingobacterium thalpophilum]|uniref:FadR/GntR family transcriptional regulator n=1 Tax=Sphingobacterium thalpophilum TaxID=259 RepID=A0A4U9VXX2_9SPHI|nr:FadR/GntR family transcriptional regulator [Sphingobacterium thalpophilum]VTR50912.1 L-lactate utilization operon repressor [Sphingobacterium thalpophilum]
MRNEAIIRRSLAEEVATAIEEKIKSGEFPIDSKLPTEPELMKQFAVGRSTIREAVKYLSQSGYLHVQQGLGTFVKSVRDNRVLDAKIEKGNFNEIFEVRHILELKIIEKASINRSQRDLKAMERALKDRAEYAKSGNLSACVDADIAFHTAIAASCANNILAELYTTLSLHVNKFFMEIYKDTTALSQSQKQHEELMEAIKDKDVERAKQIADRIILHK